MEMLAGVVILDLTSQSSCGLRSVAFDVDIREVLWKWISSDVDIIGMS